MQLFSASRLAAVLALSGALAFQSACSNEPTSDVEAPSFATGPVLTVGGPDSIYKSGNYTYGAHFGVPYAGFGWYTRYCTTFTVASCTAPWVQAVGASMPDPWRSLLTRYLTYTCAVKANKTFQVKVIGTGFGQPAQTAYRVTKLCGTNPLL